MGEPEKMHFVRNQFVKESELTLPDKRELMQKLVKTYNETPIELRDHFTRGILNAVGITPEVLAAVGLQINLEPPPEGWQDSNDKPSSGLILTF